MLNQLFQNPAFLVAAAALISVPIIIHLINRLRFKRIRWAAMEFLLKAQKKSRRRLIIEQLLLLMLRCMLVALAGFLVLRFTGCDDKLFAFGSQEHIHVILLDDSLSMNDRWKGSDGQYTDAFKVATKNVLIDDTLNKISQSTINQRVVLVPLSRLKFDRDFVANEYRPRGSDREIERFKADVLALKCTKVHLEPLQGLRLAKEIAEKNATNRVTVHLLSDYRKKDWTSAEAKVLHDEVLALSHLDKDRVKVRLVDCVNPFRLAGQGGLPDSHDNVGIIDFRASTRVTGNGMPISFSITVANFSPRDADVAIDIFNNKTGAADLEVTFNERMPLKVPANGIATASYERRYIEEIKEGETKILQFYARLENPDKSTLDDGLLADNMRFFSVELRNKVPVLVIDGLGPDGRKENGDSFFLEAALNSVPGSTYEIVFGDKLKGGDGREALDDPDLSIYPTILLLNVPSLTDKQLANLENFVRQGGGVGIFMGPQVDSVFYNQKMYNDGAGLFPAPLADSYFPGRNQNPLLAEFNNRYQLLLRDDQFPAGEKLPVFGPVLKEPSLRDFMKHLPVKRYFPTLPVAQWKTEPGVTRIIASLPNEEPVGKYVADANAIAQALPVEKDEYREYVPALRRHFKAITNAISATSKASAYDLAGVLEAMLTDRGNPKDQAEYPDLTQFWQLSDPKIDTLRKDVVALRKRALYSSPMVLTRNLAKGRVIAVMTTAGRGWNDWAGGGVGSFIYAPLMWEMQNYLSGQAGEASLLVGDTLKLTVDGRKYGNRALIMDRFLLEADPGGAAKIKAAGTDKFPDAPPEGKVEGDGEDNKPKVEVKEDGKKEAKDIPGLTFTFNKTLEPGCYATALFPAGVANRDNPLQAWGHVYNVDTRNESNLTRASRDDLASAVLREGGDNLSLKAPGDPGEDLIDKPRDWSQWPFLFLIILGILVAEQALAVHLSFHLRGSDADLPAAATAARAA